MLLLVVSYIFIILSVYSMIYSGSTLDKTSAVSSQLNVFFCLFTIIVVFTTHSYLELLITFFNNNIILYLPGRAVTSIRVNNQPHTPPVHALDVYRAIWGVDHYSPKLADLLQILLTHALLELSAT